MYKVRYIKKRSTELMDEESLLEVFPLINKKLLHVEGISEVGISDESGYVFIEKVADDYGVSK